MIDVIRPRNNEKDLISMAEKLGYSGLCFLYDRPDRKTRDLVAGLQKSTGLKLYIGSGRASPNADLVFTDINDKNPRQAMEDGNVDAVHGFEKIRARDRTNQRISGLDTVLCRIAAQKGKIYCVDFGSMIGMSGSARANAMGKLRQNLMLCRKYRIRVAIASFASGPMMMRNPLDLSAFLAVLGYDEGRKTAKALEERAAYNQKKKKGDIIAEGVEKKGKA
ncbi:MAG: RNase P subunit p30 family protein [Candidatus Woesearchaeota archaeon]